MSLNFRLIFYSWKPNTKFNTPVDLGVFNDLVDDVIRTFAEDNELEEKVVYSYWNSNFLDCFYWAKVQGHIQNVLRIHEIESLL